MKLASITAATTAAAVLLLGACEATEDATVATEAAATEATDAPTTAATEAEATTPTEAPTTEAPATTEKPKKKEPIDEVALDPAACSVDSFGSVDWTGSVTNESSKESDYWITVRFTAAGVQIDTGTAIVNRVPSGGTAVVDVYGYLNPPPTEPLVCEVVEVRRTAS